MLGDHKQQRSYTAGSLGTLHTGKPAFFTCLHAIALVAFTMFTNSYEVFTSVMSTPIPRHALPASQWLREVCALVAHKKGPGLPPSTTTNYCFQMYPYTFCTPN